MVRPSLNPVSPFGAAQKTLQQPRRGRPVGSTFGMKTAIGLTPIRRRREGVMTHLKYLRKRSGLTLEALSEMTSISVSYLSRLESGSRRLNTDLIRRLSKAFSCEPAELLQDVTHDESTLISSAPPRGYLGSGVYATLTRRSENVHRQRAQAVEIHCDLPIYQLRTQSNAEGTTSELTVELGKASEWRYRPVELIGNKEAFALRVHDHLSPHFLASQLLMLTPVQQNLAPETTVLLLDQNGTALLRKVWSVTPTRIQVCELSVLEKLKSGEYDAGSKSGKNNLLTEYDRTELKGIYRVVGYMDTDIA